MVKVTFPGQDGVYWAVCERVSYVDGHGYILDNMQIDSVGVGPHPYVKTPESWRIILVEGA